MKALKMRGLFVPKTELARKLEAGVEHVFLLLEDDMKEKLEVEGRMAHLHMLVAAYQRFKADAASGMFDNGFGIEPACVSEMVANIIGASDPRFVVCDEFLDEHVDFDPIRTPEFAGKRYFAYITDKDMFAKLWDWYEPNRDKNDKSPENAKGAWKSVLQAAMKNRDRPRVQIRPTTGGVQKEVWAYNLVAWKS